MTSLVTVKKEVKELKQRLVPKPDDVITVYMWRPNNFPDKPYVPGSKIRIKRLTPEMIAEAKEKKTCQLL